MRLAALCLASCAGATPAPKAPEHDDAPPVPVHHEVDDRATLVKLEPGDGACYVSVTQADGKPATLPGDFDLCPGGATDATPLVGTTIRYATRHGKIHATPCQPNQDCVDSESVDLVITIVPAP